MDAGAGQYFKSKSNRNREIKKLKGNDMEKKNHLMSIDEAAAYLGVKKSTLYRWKFERKIPCMKVGHLLKFRREQLDQWLSERQLWEKENDWGTDY